MIMESLNKITEKKERKVLDSIFLGQHKIILN